MEWKSYAEQARGGGQQSAAITGEEAGLRFFEPKAGSPRLNIRIGSGLLKRAKINIKDTVDLLVSEDNSKILVKRADRGWKLNEVTGGNGEFSVPWSDSKALFPFKAKTYTKAEAKLSDGGIVLDIPDIQEAS